MLRLLTFGGLALESDGVSAAPRLRPARLALLSVLAAGGERGCSRERLAGLFWPDTDEEHARHSLRQTLYALRSEVGQDLVQTVSSLSLNPAQITSDLAEFRAALATRDSHRAAALYRGPFLDGFYLSGMPEFERWVELERARLAGAATSAMLALANATTAAGDHDAAVLWWHRLTLLEPLSGRMATGYARALAATGDRPKALAFVREHESAVRRELEAEPDPDIRRLEAELRALPQPKPTAARGNRHSRVPATPSEPAEVPEPAFRRPPPASGSPASRRRRMPRGFREVGLAVAIVGIVAVLWTQSGFSRARDSRSPAIALERAATRSAVAARFYQEGLRAFYAQDWNLAKPLMAAALREDSTFAMAAYYTAVMTGGPALQERRRALRLARRAPERERLMIMADLLQRDQEPAAVAAAEAWIAKYPDDPRAQANLGSARWAGGNWVGAAVAYERAIELDLAAERAGQPGCPVCNDFYSLAELYFWWDSLPAADRTARRALDAHPEQGGSWATRAIAAARAGDSASASEYQARYLASSLARPDKGHQLRLWLTLEDYAAVEREAVPLLASSREDDALQSRAALLTALRNEGRLNEAAQLLRTGRLGGSPPPTVPVGTDYVTEALLAFEGGDVGRAASVFDTRRRIDQGDLVPGARARWLAWNTTLTATALARVGDTLAVRRFADTVQYWGQRSLFGRDRKLHHFLRGLLLAESGQHEAAVAEYRAAVYSWTLGYTRVNYELGRCLLRLGRPQEAVAALTPALRGEIDAANTYITRTELHELLAQAYRAAGQPDSAAVHDRAVVRAWAHADRRFLPRRVEAERGLGSR